MAIKHILLLFVEKPHKFITACSNKFTIIIAHKFIIAVINFMWRFHKQ